MRPQTLNVSVSFPHNHDKKYEFEKFYCSIYCVGGWGLDPYYNSMVGGAREEETEQACKLGRCDSYLQSETINDPLTALWGS